ncbi:MAG TPA: NUDIX domain-containing protein [Gaiellaceae bacterium]|nr:NUDIX domain-containing protein [Gaiellaceae bacterium]
MSEYMRRLREKIGHDFVLVPSAAALIRDDGGRVLLVRHVEGRWQMPGGAVDPDESPADAMRRECLEEASIEVEPRRIRGVFGGPDYRRRYANGDEVGIVSTVYEAEIVSGTPRPGDDETQEVGWFAPHELEGVDLSMASRATLQALLRGS